MTVKEGARTPAERERVLAYRPAMAGLRRIKDPTVQTRRAAALLAEVDAALAEARHQRNRTGHMLLVAGWRPAHICRLMGVNRGGLVKLRERWAVDTIVALGVQTTESLAQLERDDRSAYRALIAQYELVTPPGTGVVDGEHVIEDHPVAQPEQVVELAGARAAKLRAIRAEVVALRLEAMRAMLAVGARPVDIAAASGLTRGEVAQIGITASS